MVKKIVIEEHVIPDKRLGRHIEHDPRSLAWPIVTKVITIRTLLHRMYGIPLNQGNLGSCTGNATAGALNSEGLHKRNAKVLKEPEAIELYSLATQLDSFAGSYPPDDTGSSGLAVAKAAQQKGYIVEYRHAFSIDDALQALMTRPVITGVDWYEGFDHPDNNGLVKIEGQIRGGHEFVVLGYNAKEKLVIAMNSWGDLYGKKGKFFFHLDDWAKLLSQGGDATVLIN